MFALECTEELLKVKSLALSRVAICWHDIPSHGQLYVAMSRVKRVSDFFYGVNVNDLEECLRLCFNCDAIEMIGKEMEVVCVSSLQSTFR